MPEEIVLPWLKEYGFEETERILGALQEIHPVSIRFAAPVPEKAKREYLDGMERWICGHFPFALESMAPYLPKAFAERAKKGFLQLMPGRDACDGFFLARLKCRR